jgi:hypothetical protein
MRANLARALAVLSRLPGLALDRVGAADYPELPGRTGSRQAALDQADLLEPAQARGEDVARAREAGQIAEAAVALAELANDQQRVTCSPWLASQTSEMN